PLSSLSAFASPLSLSRSPSPLSLASRQWLSGEDGEPPRLATGGGSHARPSARSGGRGGSGHPTGGGGGVEGSLWGTAFGSRWASAVA
ncbi:Os04g0172560, partial [Oryza sativa Japonica Group]